MSSRVLSYEEFDEVSERIRAGEDVPGALWLGLPAQTPDGQKRESSCVYSELTHSGRDWLGLSRCLKQVLYSCDGCFRYTDKPFYREVP